ncbi:Major facilitator superfamily domain-containing protein 6-B [Porphyridium purpureum]|uniref:Major facilitator superfamily domain-containing protein 6-B n=1 Tax=Porphyridium purpureum TaxID=35688 RepID=A0A5J4YV66_PORPP|nr:Major facilitator superfamily domain-containing protein 6-B [Porphyridium purpureum]|eukprot:POR9608..scf229_5
MPQVEGHVVSVWKLKGAYLLLYAAIGAYGPFMPVLYKQEGLLESQIGLLLAATSAVTTLSTPLWCVWADATQAHKAIVLLSCALGSAFRLFLIPAASRFATAMLVTVCMTAVYSATLPLFDTFVVHSVFEEYGPMRKYGAVGFGLMVAVSGLIVTRFGYMAAIYVSVSFNAMAFAILASLDLDAPFRRAHVQHANEHDGHDGSESDMPHRPDADVRAGDDNLVDESESEDIEFADREPLVLNEQPRLKRKVSDFPPRPEHFEEEPVSRWIKMLRLGQDPHVAVFVFVLLFSGIANGMIEGFLFVRLSELGASGWLLGLSRLLMCAGEVPFFEYNDSIVRALGIFGTLAFVQAAYIVRFTTYSLLTNPMYVLLVEVLHGVTFGSLWALSTQFGRLIAPPKLEATTQSLISVVHWGIGFTAGSILGGHLYVLWGAVNMFRCGAMIVACTLTIALLAKACLGEREYCTSRERRVVDVEDDEHVPSHTGRADDST